MTIRPWIITGTGSGSLVLAAFAISALAQEPAGSVGDVKVSLGNVVGGILLFLSGYLFTSSIRQGKDITRLQTKDEERAKILERHDGDIATVDKRIETSRHGLRNELTAHLGAMEERLTKQLSELRQEGRS
jgi:hypothetical protein